MYRRLVHDRYPLGGAGDVLGLGWFTLSTTVEIGIKVCKLVSRQKKEQKMVFAPKVELQVW